LGGGKIKNEQTTTMDELEWQDIPNKYCPLQILECTTRCAWYVTNLGVSECAIVKLAKGGYL